LSTPRAGPLSHGFHYRGFARPWSISQTARRQFEFSMAFLQRHPRIDLDLPRSASEEPDPEHYCKLVALNKRVSCQRKVQAAAFSMTGLRHTSPKDRVDSDQKNATHGESIAGMPCLWGDLIGTKIWCRRQDQQNPASKECMT
jgi:hypothetical protein